CNGCMLSDNHDLCVLDFINNVNARVKSKSVKKSSKRKVWKPTGKVFTNIGYIWRPTGRTFTILGNACPLTRITTTTEVPLRKLTALENETPKPVVTLVYSRKPRKSKTNVPVSKSKVLKSVSANNKEPSQSWGSIVSNVPSSSLDECRNDHVAKILRYGDYQIKNVTISRVYYMEGLGHNLLSVRQLCDSNLEVAFRQHTCFIRNLEEDNHDLDVAHMNNDPFFGILIPENDSEASSSSDVIPMVVYIAAPYSKHVTKWTKDHPLDNIIGELVRPVSIRLQLHEQALFCYYNAFLSLVEPKTYKDALTQSCWIEAMQEELNEFERLESRNSFLIQIK
ncbi:hypothetical protein Tco_1462726, partial [Tanacetum coccineum]